MTFVKREVPPIRFCEDVSTDDVRMVAQETSGCRDEQSMDEKCLTLNDSLQSVAVRLLDRRKSVP